MTTLAGHVGLAPKNGGRSFRTGPWSSRQLAGIGGGNALAILLATVGWWNTSSEPRADDQIGWLNLSFAGVIVAIGINTVFLARGRHTIRLATSVVLDAAPPPGSAPAATVSANGHPRQERLVSMAGTQRYHRAGCALVAGKSVEHNTAEAFVGIGRHPCEVCEP